MSPINKTSIKKHKKTLITSNKISKKVSLDETIGENLMKYLLKEANELIQKRSNKSSLKNIYNSSDNDSEDSDYVPKEKTIESELDDLPIGVDYLDEEKNYFVSLPKTERECIVDQELDILNHNTCDIPIRFKILKLHNLNIQSKSNIISRIDKFYTLESSDNEYNKLHTWVNWLEKIPFDDIWTLPISNISQPLQIGKYLNKTKQILDKAVYGHNIAKNKIIGCIAKQISNPLSEGICIGIQGPMGNGKTTLVKEGICKAIDRPFAFIALGGMQDSSYLMGHEYTYEGSKPGRIIEILTECSCMNPVIYFDELDKLSETSKGDEIANLLCHLTDTSQNKEFQDKYLSGINFDLSRAIFIFSYNEESKINPILLDRMYKIKTDGFNKKSKLIIAQNYLIPKIITEFNFNKNDIVFEKETIASIIDNYTGNEKGVRNLKRTLETIISKVNVLQYLVEAKERSETDIYGHLSYDTNSETICIYQSVMDILQFKSNNNVIPDIIDLNIKKFTLPFIINRKNIDKFIKNTYRNISLESLYI